MVITDLQVGSMGGMAISLALRNDESVSDSLRTPILMLLDRQADVYLAQRSQADAWLIKPLDALRLKRAAVAAFDGSGLFEGVPDESATDDEPGDGPGDTSDPETADSETGHSPEEQPATAG